MTVVVTVLAVLAVRGLRVLLLLVFLLVFLLLLVLRLVLRFGLVVVFLVLVVLVVLVVVHNTQCTCTHQVLKLAQYAIRLAAQSNLEAWDRACPPTQPIPRRTVFQCGSVPLESPVQSL